MFYLYFYYYYYLYVINILHITYCLAADGLPDAWYIGYGAVDATGGLYIGYGAVGLHDGLLVVYNIVELSGGLYIGYGVVELSDWLHIGYGVVGLPDGLYIGCGAIGLLVGGVELSVQIGVSIVELPVTFIVYIYYCYCICFILHTTGISIGFHGSVVTLNSVKLHHSLPLQTNINVLDLRKTSSSDHAAMLSLAPLLTHCKYK